MKKLLIVVLMQLASAHLIAQEKPNKGKFFNITEIGVLPTVSSKNAPGVAFEGEKTRGTLIRTTFGTYLNPRFSVGVGFGVTPYINPGINNLPLFADFRGYLKSARSTPFAFLSMGHTIKMGSNWNSGIYSNFGVGWRFPVGKKIEFVPSVGYNFQQIRNEYTWEINDDVMDTQKENGNIQSLSISFGVHF